MPQTINTNVLSLNAQRNLTNSQSSLQTSLERLSSGLRINSAKDDAAGLAISERFSTQIRGFNQAIRNANDGISLSQTAEGALAETGSSLQRIRELAIQSANSTNSASDRAALNQEVTALLSEIQRVGSTTEFNGQNILDGSFQAAQFQVGANANQVISISVDGATTDALGAFQASSTAVTSSAFDGAGFTINGIEVGVSVATGAAGVTADSAAAKATTINGVSNQTGVTAAATNSVVGDAPVAGASLGNGALLVNGISVGSIASDASAVTQGNNARDAINAVSSQSGVSAVADATTGALTLTAIDGRNIALTGSTATAQGATDIQNATGLDISAGTNASGNNTATFQIAGTFDTSAPAANSLTEGDTATIDGVVYEFTANATASTAGNVAVTLTDGVANTVVATQLAAAINAQQTLGNTTFSADSGVSDTVTVTNAKLGNEAPTFAESNASAITETLSATTGTDAADGNGVTTRGTLTLSSGENFTLGGADLGFAGLASASTSLTQLANVDISTITGANDAITIIDGALSQITSSRSELGATQNRFESTISTLATATENLSAARSRIVDADFASETAALTRSQILQQAGISILSQANAQPQLVLALLQ